jgi:outer membrane usher protein
MAACVPCVDVDGIAGIPVYVENQLVTHTDAHGKALLHNLISYEPNRISIAPEDLPLNTSVDSRSLVIQPAYRSGVIARFPVQRISPAVFRLHLPDGSPVPAGASVQLNGGTFPVAMEGMTYVTTLDREAGGTATWTGGRCAFRVDAPPPDDPMPDMGKVTCRTATPGAP